MPLETESDGVADMNGGRRRRVVVIGAGIIGVCCAAYLLREGYEVELVDPVDPGSPDQCSYGNSGVISSSTFIPNATPGMIRSIPGWLLDPDGPLSIRPLYLPTALPWLLRFLANSREDRARDIAAALYSITSLTYDCYAPILKAAGCEELLQARGLLILYEDPTGPDKGGFGFDLRREYGVPMELLDERQVHDMEPGLGSAVKRAVLLPTARHCPNPGRLVATLAAHAVEQGAILTRDKATNFRFDQTGVSTVCTEGGREISCDHLVLAAGSRSGSLAKMLGISVPLEHERGYHIMIPCDQAPLKTIAVSAERRMTITPMEEGLRFTGTEEFAGADAPADPRRTEILARGAKHLFPELDLTSHTTWMGRRPGMPDSKPVIARSDAFGNTVFAFGHGHQGMIGGAVTGRVVAELVSRKPASIDLRPFRANRF